MYGPTWPQSDAPIKYSPPSCRPGHYHWDVWPHMASIRRSDQILPPLVPPRSLPLGCMAPHGLNPTLRSNTPPPRAAQVTTTGMSGPTWPQSDAPIKYSPTSCRPGHYHWDVWPHMASIRRSDQILPHLVP